MRLYNFPTRREEKNWYCQKWDDQEASELDERLQEDTMSNSSEDGHTDDPDDISSLDQQIVTTQRARINPLRENIRALKPESTKHDEQIQQVITELHQKDTENTRDQEELWRKFEEKFGPQRVFPMQESATDQSEAKSRQQTLTQDQVAAPPHNVQAILSHNNSSQSSPRSPEATSGSSVLGSFDSEVIQLPSFKQVSNSQADRETLAGEFQPDAITPVDVPLKNSTADPLLSSLRRRFDERKLQIAQLKESIAEAKTELGRKSLKELQIQLETEQFNALREISYRKSREIAQAKSTNRSLLVLENEAEQDEFSEDEEDWVGDALLSLLGDGAVQEERVLRERGLGADEEMILDRPTTDFLIEAKPMQEEGPSTASIEEPSDEIQRASLKSERVAQIKIFDSWIEELQTITHARMGAIGATKELIDSFGRDSAAERLQVLEAKQSYDENRVQEWTAQRDTVKTLLELMEDQSSDTGRHMDLDHHRPSSPMRVTSLEDHHSNMPAIAASASAIKKAANVETAIRLANLKKNTEELKAVIRSQSQATVINEARRELVKIKLKQIALVESMDARNAAPKTG